MIERPPLSWSRRTTWLICGLLTAVIGASLVLTLAQLRRGTLEVARAHARSSFAQDVLYRRWNAMHGGVYAPSSDATPPNPHLETERRDITSPSGVELTLVNPAYMTRQVHELGFDDGGVIGHITSLDPIRPENAADPWETSALRAFDEGEPEVSGLETLRGTVYMRLMRPLVTEQPCLACHADQGYVEGQVRGGISVAVPFTPLQVIERGARRSLLLWHSLFWLLAMGATWAWDRSIRRRFLERERWDRDLLEHAERFEQMFAQHDAVMMLIEPETGRIVDANAAATRFYGYAHDELCAMDIQDINQLSAEEVLDELKNALEQQRNLFVFPHKLCDGELRTVEVHSTAFEHREQALLLSIVHDITEREHGKLEREQLSEQLTQAQKMEAIGLLAGGMAHDFNNMLMIILGNAEMVREDMPPTDPNLEYIDDIIDAGERSKDLTTKLLAFARKGTLELRKIHLSEVLFELESLMSRTLSKKIDLTVAIQDDCLVRADRTQLQQALLNICMNAAEAMPQGGQLTLEVRLLTAEEQAVAPMGPQTPPGCVITITDEGSGMDAETAARAMEPFFTTKDLGKGTGLGLSVSHGIIHSHNGSLSINSSPDAGSRVRVYLPLAAGDEDQPRPVAGDDLPRGDESLLLIDDEPSILRVAERLLTRAGYTVVSAEGGRRGLELYRQRGSEFSLVILDMMMPELSGPEVYQALVELDPKVRVLLSSGYSRQGEAEALLEQGVAGFVQKPYAVATLSHAVRNVLDDV